MRTSTVHFSSFSLVFHLQHKSWTSSRCTWMMRQHGQDSSQKTKLQHSPRRWSIITAIYHIGCATTANHIKDGTKNAPLWAPACNGLTVAASHSKAMVCQIGFQQKVIRNGQKVYDVPPRVPTKSKACATSRNAPKQQYLHYSLQIQC